MLKKMLFAGIGSALVGASLAGAPAAADLTASCTLTGGAQGIEWCWDNVNTPVNSGPSGWNVATSTTKDSETTSIHGHLLGSGSSRYLEYAVTQYGSSYTHARAHINCDANGVTKVETGDQVSTATQDLSCVINGVQHAFYSANVFVKIDWDHCRSQWVSCVPAAYF